MWIDTHTHLDASEFDADRDAVVARARAAGVSMLVICAAAADHFDACAQVAARYDFVYALGVHPLFIERSHESDIERLRQSLRAARDDPRLVAVGEIGLDFFIENPDVARQEWFYREQLRVARDAGLPVIVHVRRSADMLLKHLRRIEVAGGIAHAFNGSEQQAMHFIELGFKLGFGGALTYNGSKRIRHLAAILPAHAWVLETDSPDIPPEWLRSNGRSQRNEPAELARIAQQFAQLRGMTLEELAAQNQANACAALPRLASRLSVSPTAEAR